MNIHPIFVHFPVALLLVYSILETIRFRKVTTQQYWFYLKAFLVILGTLSAYVTLWTGDLAKDIYSGPLSRSAAHQIISIHSTIAGTTTFIYTIIALFYLIGWLRRSNVIPFRNSILWIKVWNILVQIEIRITEGAWGILVAIIGGLLISLTGALGGLIAYGPVNDAISTMLYNFIIK